MLNARTKAIAVRARIQPPFLSVSSVMTPVVVLGYLRKPGWCFAAKRATMSVNPQVPVRLFSLMQESGSCFGFLGQV